MNIGSIIFFGCLFVIVIGMGIFTLFECRAYDQYMHEKLKEAEKDPHKKENLWASLMPPSGGL